MLDYFKLKKQIPLALDRSIPVTEARYVVIDTELTGLNEQKDQIISIGALKLSGGRIEIGNAFYRLVKPGALFKPESVVIHGITPSDVKQSREIDGILSEFLEFCGNDILLGHCVLIDMTFLNREMKRVFGRTSQNSVIDTYKVYEWLRQRRHSDPCFSSVPKDPALYEIAQCFDIPVRGAHEAIIDAFITAQLFQRFIPLLVESGVSSVGELCDVGNPARRGDHFVKVHHIANL